VVRYIIATCREDNGNNILLICREEKCIKISNRYVRELTKKKENYNTHSMVMFSCSDSGIVVTYYPDHEKYLRDVEKIEKTSQELMRELAYPCNSLRDIECLSRNIDTIYERARRLAETWKRFRELVQALAQLYDLYEEEIIKLHHNKLIEKTCKNTCKEDKHCKNICKVFLYSTLAI